MSGVQIRATYERHLDEGAGVVTIGYARKSYENEAMSIRGRWLWMLKEHYHVPINLKAACERHVEEEADVVTIGYTRKSYGYESMTTHARLIQSQVDSLRGRYLARKVSVSSRCNASIPLEDRGKKQGDSMVKIGQIENCAGTMQDLVHRLRTFL
ncbi:hypothetical protein CU097_005227 [Rhizopus azygosporus]|uniref:Uncharacterized protein n=2 Tax=Rhizopus TaxID=4842 RepID=A0A367K063_RHIAZ|nr:hypothetical protein CU097_005227 [Rhizopus azygosporus]